MSAGWGFFCGGKKMNEGKLNPNWKGGRCINGQGYVFLWMPEHPYKNKDNQVAEHRLVVEKVIGRFLKPSECVHHNNENVQDNRKRNLVACENNSYHMLLHRRLRAYRTCGHANWMLCRYCSQYDSPENLYISANKKVAYHRFCNAAFQASYKKGISYKTMKADWVIRTAAKEGCYIEDPK